MRAQARRCQKMLIKKVHNWRTSVCRAHWDATGDVSCPAVFPPERICRWLFLLLTVWLYWIPCAKAERWQHFVFRVKKTYWKRSGPEHSRCKCFCPWQTSCQGSEQTLAACVIPGGDLFGCRRVRVRVLGCGIRDKSNSGLKGGNGDLAKCKVSSWDSRWFDIEC